MQEKKKLHLCNLFFRYFFLIWLSWFSFWLDRISQVHDMTIKSFFYYYFFHDLSTPGNDAYHKLLSRLKHHFSSRNCFERVIFWSKGCSCHFCPKKRLWLKRYSRKMGNCLFYQHAPRHQSRMILKYYGPGTCVFGHWKGVGRLEAIVSLDAYQIIKYQVLQKLIIFCCLISKEFKKKILKSRIFLAVALAGMIKRFIWF